jgi:peptidoglycan/xylan/chitin deacetylase (PgdA/CDA1 family)
MSALTIVMYHYVRDLPRTRYPRIKGRTIEEFEGQLDYIQKHYTVTTTRAVIEASRGGRPLPPNACLMTFDDGFLDHYTTVFPRLLARGLSGSFYPPAVVARGGRVLDVHKIHFILAVTEDHVDLADRVIQLIDARRRDVDLPTTDALKVKHWKASRFDGPETAFIKGVLQKGLDAVEVRSGIVGSLFEERVGVDEAVFARELYLDVPQLRTMLASGMEVGGHGAEHVWLDQLGAAEQRTEIAGTRAFLADVHGRVPVDWVMCYPYGAYDEVTLRLAAEAGAALGVTADAEKGLAWTLDAPLRLPRLDTNDLPLRGDAGPVAWTLEALTARGAAPVAAAR